MNNKNKFLVNTLAIMSACYLSNIAAQVPTSQYWTDYLASRSGNSDLRKPADTLADNKVMPNFSYVGYEFGNHSLPTEGFSGYGDLIPEFDPILSNHKIFNVINFGAIPDDSISDKQAIKNTLAAAQAYLADAVRSVDSQGVPSFDKGAIVYFPKGKFLVNEDSDMSEFNLYQGNKGSGDDKARNKAACEQPFFVYANNIIIRGAGSGETGTELYMKNHFTTPYENIMYSNAHLFMVGPFPEDYWRSGAATNTQHCDVKGQWKTSAEIIKTHITSTINLRDSSRTIVVEDASSFTSGQWVRLRGFDQRADSINASVSPYLVESAWSKLKKGLDERQINRIVSIDYSNNSVTLAAPLLAGIDAKIAGGNWTLESHNHSESIGFEHLTIKGNAVADFSHHQDYIHDNGWSALLYNRTQNSWVKDVRFTSMSEGIQVKNVAANTIQDVTFDGNRGHLSFGLEVSSSVLALNIHEPSSYWHGAGPSSHSSGNVFLNYAFNADTAPNIHASQPRQNLYDNISGGWSQGHWGGASSSQPNHLNHLIFWNQTNNSDSKKDFEFMQTNGIYGRIIMPYLVGNHGKSLPIAKRQAYADSQNNGNQHGDALQAYVESMDSVVKPYSLYESQVKQRFGELPAWLVNATNKVRYIKVTALSEAGDNSDLSKSKVTVLDRFGYQITQSSIEFSTYPSSKIIDLGDFYQASAISFTPDNTEYGRLTGIQIDSRAYAQNDWQQVHSNKQFAGNGEKQTIEIVKPVYKKISYETPPPVVEPPYEGPIVEQVDGLSFSGAGEYVELSDIDYGEGNKFTVALWTKFGAQDTDAFILRKSDYGTKNPVYIAATKTGYIQAGVNGIVASKSGISDDKWHHITMVLDGTVLKLYVDGILKSTKTNIVPVSNDRQITVGGSPSGKRSFKGDVDDVRIYQSALSADDVFNLTNQPRIQSAAQMNADLCFSANEVDLAAYLPLQDKKDLTCNAASDNEVDKGKLINSPTWIVTLVPAPDVNKVEQVEGLSFSGTGDYVELSDINYGTGDKFSVALWTRFGAQNTDAFIIRKSDYGTGNPFYIAATKTGYIQAKVNGRGPSKSGMWDGKWHHITMVLNGTELSLYVDGILTSKVGDIVPVSNSKNITIGGAPSAKRSFKGDVDDIRIYQSVLTSEQVAIIAGQSRIKPTFELDNNLCFSHKEASLVVYLPLQDKQDLTCNTVNQNVSDTGLLVNYPQWITTMVNDTDNDTVADIDDAFPLAAAEWLDTDSDGMGNNADPDDDNDGVADIDDAFPLDAAEWLDTDSDGTGNNADLDDDNDGVADTDDAFPLDATEWLDTDSDGTGNNADLDDDNDGVLDEHDLHLGIVVGTVVFNSVETGITERVNENGVPLSVLLSNKLAELSNSSNHGEFINEMTRYIKNLHKSGLINKQEWKLLKDIIH